MMTINYEQLKKSIKQTSLKQENRHVESRNLYEKGQSLLSTAIVKKYDKDILQEAGDCFVEGIKLNRNEPYNYIGLAYLLLLANQPKEAQHAIQAALYLDPANKMALHLKTKTEKTLTLPSKPAIQLYIPELDMPHEAIDFDSLYDQVEQEIFLHLKIILEHQSQAINPTLDPMRVHQIKVQKEELVEISNYINKCLNIVEQEIDTSDLRAKLKPFEIRFKQLEVALDVSEHFSVLQRELKNHIKWTHLAISQLTKKMVVVMEKKLESFIDQCDRIADELDELEDKGFDISEIECIYNDFVTSVEVLQQELEKMEATF